VKASVKPGDRIAGLVHGANQTDLGSGGFAEYAMIKDGMFIKVPDSLPTTDAATLGIALSTICQGLYRSLKLPPISSPAKEKFPLLIYGGSTAMGTMAVQFAKMSGAEVITTASPRNFDLVKSYGADVVFDYNESNVGDKIREHTKNKLRLVFDCFSDEGAQKIAAEALSSDSDIEGGLHYSTLLPGKEKAFPRQDVDSRSTFAYLTMGEEFEKKGNSYPADSEEHEAAKNFWAEAQKLFEQGKLKTHPTDVRNGIDGIPQGLDDLKEGKVSGKKLVYTI
jgi:NADPH:quinone reductase-like Zn-dependent oxidoreductase